VDVKVSDTVIIADTYAQIGSFSDEVHQRKHAYDALNYMRLVEFETA